MLEEQLTILLVEDDETDKEAVERLLDDEYVLLHAETGQQAIEILGKHIIDCVLLDNQLPDTTGVDLITSFKNRNVPVIFLTGTGSESIAVEAMKSGALDYLNKDQLSRVKLQAAIQKSIQVKVQQNQYEVESVLLKQLAYNDALTRLPNRAQFDETLSRTIANSLRHKRVFALLYIDIDHFKMVNDQFGHLVGDMLLQNVAMRLRSICRTEDIVSRLSGDEFAIILPDIKEIHDGGVIAKKIIKVLNEPYLLKEQYIAVGASVGVVCFDPHSQDAASVSELKNFADIALYRAKELGRNNYQYFSDNLHASHLQRLKLEKALMQATVKLSFKPVYLVPDAQKTDLQPSAIRILFNWQNEQFGHYNHLELVQLLDELRLYGVFFNNMFEQLAENLSKLKHSQPLKWPIWVTVTTRHLSSKNFVSSFLEMLSDNGFVPSDIELELVDCNGQDNLPITLQCIKQLSEAGVNVRIGQFGLKAFQLELFKDTPVKGLIIASKLLEQVPEDGFAKQAVQSILQLADNFDIDVVAAGIEQQAQFDFVKAHHLSGVTGDFFHKEMDIDAFSEFLDKQQIR